MMSINSIPTTATTVTTGFSPVTAPVTGVSQARTYHQVAKVRRIQSVSLATCARKLGISINEARYQEQPTTDLTISQLMAWKEVLDVPLSELFGPIENELDNPVRNRALLLKAMKSAKQIRRDSRESGIRSMADNMIEILLKMMPELAEVTAWPEVGQSHEARPLGMAVYRQFDPEVAKYLEE